MKKYLLLISLIMMIAFTGCMERKVTNVTDEEARNLPVCIATSDTMYTLSQGTIGEVGGYVNFGLPSDKSRFKMYPRKGGKQLIFKVGGETFLIDTDYQELEKGACMEISHVKVSDENGNKSLEAYSSKHTDYRTLVKVAEYVFKF